MKAILLPIRSAGWTSLLVSLSLMGVTRAVADDKAKIVATEIATAGPDYAFQGEYAGDVGGQPVGVQVIALGGGKFDSVGYMGGLPGAGWDGNKDAITKGSGELKDGAVVLGDGTHSGTIKDGQITITDGTTTLGTLKRVERKSPTLEAKPPEGAMILFKGEDTALWQKAKVEGGLLCQGATTVSTWQSFTLHLEFRLPFQPNARGQGRGNSGCYAQGRYEVQVLDSFGLKGEHNECGGVYTVSPPKVNMCFPPLTWQTYDIDFTAAEFDASGKKTKNARLSVKHNGVEIHKDLEVDHATTAAPMPEGPQPGPLHLQDHGNPVRYRNVWILAK